MKIQLPILISLALGTSAAQAVVSLSSAGGTYSTSFDSLPTTGGSTAWANDSTLAGWSLFNKTPAAITAIVISDGAGTAGSFYSFGTISATDRALGGLGSGGTYFASPATNTVAGYMAVALTNDTPGILDTVTISYDGEQWRNNGNATAQTMILEYGFGSTFSGVTTWTAGGSAFNFTGPVATASPAAAVNGNVAGKVAGIGGTVSGLTWAPGSTMWVRWVELNDSGNDHALAIDNFSFTAVPEPSAAILGLAGLIVLLRRRH